MSRGPLFSSSLKPEHAYYRKRLWIADTFDLLLGLAAGWAVVRYFDWSSHLARAAGVIALGWIAYGSIAGSFRHTLFRAVFGVRLVTSEGHAPGPLRAFPRTLGLLADHLMLGLFHFRPIDFTLLKVKPELDEAALAGRLGRVGLQVPWLAMLVASIWLLIRPTHSEAISYLDRTLNGWKCCHGQVDSGRCHRALGRVADDARGGVPDAVKLVAECPASR